MRGMRKVAPKVGPALGRAGPALRELGTKAEQAVGKGFGRFLGPEAQVVSDKLLKGTTGEMANQAIGGAIVMPLLGGVGDAIMAPKGERLDAFTSNMGRNALEGAAFGGLSGAIYKPIRNLRQSAVTEAVKRRGLAPDAVDKSMNQGFFRNLHSVATGKGIHPTRGANRELAALNASGQLGGEAATWMLPGMIMGEGSSQETAPAPAPVTPRPAPALPAPAPVTPRPTPAYASKQATASSDSDAWSVPPSLVGAATGGISAGLFTDYLNTRGVLPTGGKGKVLNRLIPALGSVGGAYGALRLTQPSAPEPDPIQKSLTDIDFDKLLRYYKKRDDSALQV